MKEQIAMIQIGQKIDDFIDDLEFDAYQNNEIKNKVFRTMREVAGTSTTTASAAARKKFSASFRPRVL